MHKKDDSWSGGNRYEIFMGRWSMLIAKEFLDWLALPPDCSWLEVGCGTGTLTWQRLENKLRETLPIQSDGSISLTARAWAVKGTA